MSWHLITKMPSKSGYNPDWDRVVRQLATHYGMYVKVIQIKVLAGINALTR